MLAAAAAALLAGAGGSANGAPAQGRIAFGIERGSVSSLYTVRPDGNGLRRVTVPPTRQDLGGDSGPVWSPDGRRLVFERNLPYWGNDRFRLNAVPATGGIARPLTQGPFDVMPSVSPNGRRIAFTRLVASVVTPAISLFTVNARGQRPSQLLAGGFDLSPAWSPDGTAIAFTRLDSDTAPIEEAELFLAAADGSNVRPLEPGVKGISPAWAPDGSRLAFVSFADHNGASCPASNCSPNGEIYLVNADGSGLRRLTRSPRRRRASNLVTRRDEDRLRERLRPPEPGAPAVAHGDARRGRPRRADRPLRRSPRPGLEPCRHRLRPAG